MTDTIPASATGLPVAGQPRVFSQFSVADRPADLSAGFNVVAFPKLHRQHDPLDRKNLEHAFIAMHVAAQYDEDRIDGFISELIAEDRAGDIADVLNNNIRRTLVIGISSGLDLVLVGRQVGTMRHSHQLAPQ